MTDPEFQKKLMAADGIVAADSIDQMHKIRQMQAREATKMARAKRAIIAMWGLLVVSTAGWLVVSNLQSTDPQDYGSQNWVVVFRVFTFGLYVNALAITACWLVWLAFIRFRQIQFALAEVQVNLEKIGRRLDSVEARSDKKPKSD